MTKFITITMGMHLADPPLFNPTITSGMTPADHPTFQLTILITGKTRQDNNNFEFNMRGPAILTNFWVRNSMVTSKMQISCEYWTLPGPE